MPSVVTFTTPRVVELQEVPADALGPGDVGAQTWLSGISAGTELTPTAARTPSPPGPGTPPLASSATGAATFAYPVSGWGYSEVGQVVETGSEVGAVAVGDRVYGIWGHRSREGGRSGPHSETAILILCAATT